MLVSQSQEAVPAANTGRLPRRARARPAPAPVVVLNHSRRFTETPSRAFSSDSESVLQGELDLPVVRCRAGDGCCSWEVDWNLPASTAPRQTEVRVVEEIEEFGAELQLL